MVDPCVTLAVQYQVDFAYDPAKAPVWNPIPNGPASWPGPFDTAGAFLTQVGSFPPPVASRLLRLGDLDGIRCMANASLLDNLRVNINNDTVNCSISDYISVHSRFANSVEVKDTDYSGSTPAVDQFIKYLDADFTPQLVNNLTGMASGQPDQGLIGVARNPLGTYGDDGAQMTRGSFNYDFIRNPIWPTSTQGEYEQFPTATVVFTIREPILMAPFAFGRQNEPGLIGIRNMQINGQFTQNLERVWSCADGFGDPFPLVPYDPPSYGTGGFPKNIKVTVLGVSASFRYITPSLTTVLPKVVQYPYYESVPQIITLKPVGAASRANSALSSSFNMPSLPRRLYFYLQQTKTQRSATTSDVFARIDTLTMKLGNRDGIFSSMTCYDFYRMAEQNGLNMSWTQYSKTVGSIVCVDLSSDVGLGPLEAPGLNKPTQIQIQCTYTDLQEPGMSAITYDLAVLPIYEGVFSLSPGVASHQTGILTPEDILKVSEAPLQAVKGGSRGGFGWADVWHGVKNAGRWAYNNRDSIAQAVQLARKLTGKGRSGGGVMVPGLDSQGPYKESFYGSGRKSPKRHKNRSRSPRRRTSLRY